jgi:hypothetical protein
MFHLDYLSCFLTVLATLLLGRKSWIGLLAAIVNSLLVCLIGLRTSQFGFIPANLFCICIYAFNIRSWQKAQTHTNRDQAQRQASGFIADGAPMSSAKQHRTPCLIHPKEGVPRAHLAPVQACPNGIIDAAPTTCSVLANGEGATIALLPPTYPLDRLGLAFEWETDQKLTSMPAF